MAQTNPVVIFTGRFESKVDRKGRVSVPARFRNRLAGQTFHGIAVFPSVDGSTSLTASGMNVVEDYSARFSNADPFAPLLSDSRMALFASVEPLPFDGEGRVLLPEELRAHAGITTLATFVGMGNIFQIWEPEAAAAVLRAVREMPPEERAKLTVPPAPGGER